MQPNCKRIQQLLAEEGPQALRRDEAAQQHVAECEACFHALESLQAIEQGFHAMAEFDAPESAVDALLARPEIRAAREAKPTFGQRIAAGIASLVRPRPLAWGGLATVMIAVVAVGLFTSRGPEVGGVAPDEIRVSTVPESEFQFADEEAAGEAPADDPKVSIRKYSPPPVPVEQRAGNDKNDVQLRQDEPSVDEDGRANLHGARQRDYAAQVGGVTSAGDTTSEGAQSKDSFNEPVDDLSAVMRSEEDAFRKEVGAKTEPKRKAGKKQALLAGAAGVSTPVLIEESRVVPEFPEVARVARIETEVILQVIVRADGSVGAVEVLRSGRPGMGFEEAAVAAVEQWRYTPATQGGEPVDVYLTVLVTFKLDDGDEGSSLLLDGGIRNARNFLDDRRRIDNLTFKAADGYWSNTYVPGDPALRLLQARLAGWDRSILQNFHPSMPRLHDAARQVGQPFDTPGNSALAVYLHADRRGLTEPGRMLVQVGLEGTPRQGGRRPAMNVALVLDLRGEITQETAISLRTLLEAFNRAKEPGDRFRIFAAGRDGGCVVEPEEFRHGFLKVTLDRLVAAPTHEVDRNTTGLAATAALAIASVAAVDDPDAPLGSNAVVLITARPFGSETPVLADLAHQGAVAGATMSVIGIGNEIDLAEIDRVTLAGQGHRRLLDEPAEASALVDRELSATSRAIARAVRLRIRLAPGVKLVDVLGSERLDERRAERVRRAERSIDLRLARNLGIDADRGEDEEGIQIVIPSFYAGDSHVVLLDVVAPGPGAIADVTVRYKDLVHLRNGVARASLDVRNEERVAGPLERNVLKNLLSFRLSRTLDEAGHALRSGDPERSVTLIDDFSNLLQGLRLEDPGFHNDPDLLGDVAMLGEYRRLLVTDLTGRPDQLALLADSLLYAARLKVLPRPLEIAS